MVSAAVVLPANRDTTEHLMMLPSPEHSKQGSSCMHGACPSWTLLGACMHHHVAPAAPLLPLSLLVTACCCCLLPLPVAVACYSCCVRLKKRKEYEDLVRRVGRWNLAVWAKVKRHTSKSAHT